MPKVAKKTKSTKKVLTVEELNKPIEKKGLPKKRRQPSLFKFATLLLLTVIAVSSSYIAYEFQSASYRISTVKSDK